MQRFVDCVVLPLIALIFLFPAPVLAQSTRISGTVTDEADTPVYGAHVQLVGSQQGVVTDTEGRFVIQPFDPALVTLRVTHLGFAPATMEVPLLGDFTFHVTIALHAVPVDVGEVTVTALRSQELQRNVLLPIDLITAPQLQRGSPVSVPDALEGEAGVTLVRDGVWGTDVSIRGLSRANVVTLVDGARIETATNHAAGLSMIDVNDVDRIEVIRGGASVLYGSGATGGVVNVLTGEGQFGKGFHMHGTLNSSYSSVNDGAAGSIGFEAADEAWFLRLRGTMRSAGDAQTPQGILPDSRFHDRSVSASAGTRVGGRHELRGRYQLFDARDVGIPGGASFPEQSSARYPFEKREMVQGEYRGSQLTGALDQLSLRVTRQRIDRNVELIPNPAVVLRPSAEHTMNAVLLQSNWNLGSHRLVAGLDAWQREYNGRRLREIKASSTIIADVPLPTARFRSIGGFVQNEWALPGERLLLTLGARADQIHVENDESYDLLYIETNGSRNEAPANRTIRWNAEASNDLSWSAHAGVLIHLMPEMDATLNLARSYRAPSLEERYQFIELGGATYLGDVSLAAEKGNTADVGVRIHTARFSLRANAFMNAMNDLVIDERRSDTLYVKNNIGEALLQGAEVTVEYNPFSVFVLHVNAAYVRGRDTGNEADLPQMPPLSTRIGLRMPVSGLLTAELLFTAAADQDAVGEGETATPGYGLLHLRLRSEAFRFSGVSAVLYAGVDNVFDRSWRRHLSTLRGIIVDEPGRNVFFRIHLLF